tara:strand:+ start:9210 stop:9944 length:735 start_codon:yes stop_codon:yes gene_type:complete
MFKRIFDFIISFLLIIIFSPIIIIFSFLIWRQDKKSPFYIASRVGKNEKLFKMIKFRSMIFNADKTGVDSTSSNDSRITPLGSLIRRYKIDEIPNFFNIIKGDMSFVGPRPNVKRETDIYTFEEKKLLSVKPGITDFASIVFFDEGDILKDSKDPDLDYNQLIRPWKSRLGILYVEKNSLFLDFYLIVTTAIAIISKPRALRLINSIMKNLKASQQLVDICLRNDDLKPYSPPGAERIVTSRNL